MSSREQSYAIFVGTSYREAGFAWPNCSDLVSRDQQKPLFYDTLLIRSEILNARSQSRCRLFPTEFDHPSYKDKFNTECREAMNLLLLQHKSPNIANVARFQENKLLDRCVEGTVQRNAARTNSPRFLSSNWGDSLVAGCAARYKEKASLFVSLDSCERHSLQSSSSCWDNRPYFPDTELCRHCAR